MFDARAHHRERLAHVESVVGPDAEPWATDRRLREYAHQRARLDAAESFDLSRAETMRIHVYFGCATFLEYLERRVGYSPHAARERMRVARVLVTLPETANELARGNLSFSAVRELSRVLTPETEREWIEAARGKTCREIEEIVAGRALGDLPADPRRPDLEMKELRITLPTECHALWREVRKRLGDERGGERVSDAEVFEAMCRAVLQPGDGAQSAPNQIAFKQCEGCGAATQNGGGREVPVAPAVLERAACDARVIGSVDVEAPERAVSSVTPRMREHVFARDGHRCRVPGCRSSRNLEVHHIEPQALGGAHEVRNLVLVCGGHHAAHHDGRLEIAGDASRLKVKWIIGAPNVEGLDDEMRAALIEREVEAIVRRNKRGGSAPLATVATQVGGERPGRERPR